MLYQKNSVWGFTKLPRLLVCLTIPILDCWQLYLPFWLCLTRTSSTCCLREAGLRWRSCSCRSRRQPLQPLQIRWECTNTVFQTRTNDSKLKINIIILGGGVGMLSPASMQTTDTDLTPSSRDFIGGSGECWHALIGERQEMFWILSAAYSLLNPQVNIKARMKTNRTGSQDNFYTPLRMQMHF